MAGFSSVSLFFDMEDNFMDLLTLLTLAVGLSMDAFAVSICKGLAMREKVLGKGVIIGFWRLSGIDANHWIFSWNTI